MKTNYQSSYDLLRGRFRFQGEPLWFRLILVALLLGAFVIIIWLLPHWVLLFWLTGRARGAAATPFRHIPSKWNNS